MVMQSENGFQVDYWIWMNGKKEKKKGEKEKRRKNREKIGENRETEMIQLSKLWIKKEQEGRGREWKRTGGKERVVKGSSAVVE